MSRAQPTGWPDGTCILARFADAPRARAAIEALQSAGVDGDDIKLVSPTPRKPTRSSTAAVDGRIARYLTGRVARGVLVGAITGLLLGALAGIVLDVVTSPASGLGVVAALGLVGIIAGAYVGAYVGFERAGTLSDAWPATFETLDGGPVWIAVLADDAETRRRARRTLEHHDAAELQVREAPVGDPGARRRVRPRSGRDTPGSRGTHRRRVGSRWWHDH